MDDFTCISFTLSVFWVPKTLDICDSVQGSSGAGMGNFVE